MHTNKQFKWKHELSYHVFIGKFHAISILLHDNTTMTCTNFFSALLFFVVKIELHNGNFVEMVISSKWVSSLQCCWPRHMVTLWSVSACCWGIISMWLRLYIISPASFTVWLIVRYRLGVLLCLCSVRMSLPKRLLHWSDHFEVN